MSFPLFETAPAWAKSLSLTIHFAAGIALGFLYFRGLWWSVSRLTGDGRVVTTIALLIGRFVLLGGLLTLAILEGSLPLLVLALGLLIARSAVMRWIQEAAR